jgi:hypothetical protein
MRRQLTTDERQPGLSGSRPALKHTQSKGENNVETKTTKQVVSEHPQYAKLIRSIVNAVGRDYMRDVYAHGANGGFPGITMTTDCMNLAWRNRTEIRALLEETYNELGEDIGQGMQSWQLIGTDYKPSEIVRAVYIEHKPRFDDDVESTIWDALPKFAAEEIARWFCEEGCI